MAGSLFPAQRLALNGIALFVKQLDIQRTGLDLVHISVKRNSFLTFWTFAN